MLLGGDPRKIIPNNVLAETHGISWIGFERDNAALRSHQAGGKQGKKTDVRTNIVKNHARAQMLLKCCLDRRFPAASDKQTASAWVQLQPQTLRRAIPDLRPCQCFTRNNLAARPTN